MRGSLRQKRKGGKLNTDKGLRDIGHVLDQVLIELYGYRVGFGLVVFPFGDGERTADYISNGARGCMINALREAADKIERGEFMPVTIGEA